MRSNLPKFLDLLISIFTKFSLGVFHHDFFFVTNQLNISRFLPHQICTTLISYYIIVTKLHQSSKFPLIVIGIYLMYLIKARGKKFPLSPYAPSGLEYHIFKQISITEDLTQLKISAQIISSSLRKSVCHSFCYSIIAQMIIAIKYLSMEDGGIDRTVIDCWQHQMGQIANFSPLLTYFYFLKYKSLM